MEESVKVRYDYRTTIVEIVDGDTVVIDLDLGFGITLPNERVSILGMNAPTAKKAATAAKKRLGELLGSHPVINIRMASQDGEDMKGKPGRILGDFITEDGRMASAAMVEEGHAVPYTGE